jgi:cell division protein FtsB
VPQQVDLGIWRRLTHLVTFLIVIAALLGIFFSYTPLFQQNERMRKHIGELEKQINVEEQNAKLLEGAITRLRNDPKTVERMAREKLGYAKPGETVIYFEPAKPTYAPLQ